MRHQPWEPRVRDSSDSKHPPTTRAFHEPSEDWAARKSVASPGRTRRFKTPCVLDTSTAPEVAKMLCVSSSGRDSAMLAGNTPQCQRFTRSGSAWWRLFQSARAGAAPPASWRACIESAPRPSASQAQGTPKSPRRLMTKQGQIPRFCSMDVQH